MRSRALREAKLVDTKRRLCWDSSWCNSDVAAQVVILVAPVSLVIFAVTVGVIVIHQSSGRVGCLHVIILAVTCKVTCVVTVGRVTVRSIKVTVSTLPSTPRHIHSPRHGRRHSVFDRGYCAVRSNPKPPRPRPVGDAGAGHGGQSAQNGGVGFTVTQQPTVRCRRTATWRTVIGRKVTVGCSSSSSSSMRVTVGSMGSGSGVTVGQVLTLLLRMLL